MRGRPRKETSEIIAEVTAQDNQETDRPKTLNRSERPQRVPINGLRDKLSLKGCEPGFHYCIVNDYNVDVYVAAGYDFVTHDLKIGDRHIDSSQAEGRKVSLPVGSGVIGYVMRIPQEWYDEDRLEEQRELDKTEETLRQDRSDGRYGKLDIIRGQTSKI